MCIRALIATLLLAANASGQTLPEVPKLKLEPIPAGEDKIVVVYEGKPAPFTGQLYSNETALRWMNYLQQYEAQTPLLLRTQRQLCLAEITYRDTVLELHDEASKKIQDDLTVRLKRVEEKNSVLQAELSKGPAWYDSRAFGFVLGFVGAGALVGLTAYTLNAAAN